ncbi:MAG: FAD binding domain-containing protein [Thermoleophilia bacterium]
MISKRFEYHTPHSVEQAVGLLAEKNGEAVVLGGGTWVVPDMTHGTITPGHVVDLRRAGLDGIEAEAGGLRIGATATYTQILESELVRERAPALHALAVGITGGAQLRNQATMGGGVCYALPSADPHGALVALGARYRLASKGGVREVDAESFYTGVQQSVLQPGELLTDIIVPEQPAGSRQGYYKFKLCESSWPIVTACAVVVVDGSGTVTSARVAVGGASETPYLVDTAGIVGATLGPEQAAVVAAAAEAACARPYGDPLASGEYRKMIAGAIAKRALLAAAG